MIEVVQHRIRILPFKATEEETELAIMAVNSYGFILKEAPFCEKKRFSFKEFADRIAYHYDTANPRNAEVVRALQSIHQRNPGIH